MTAARVVPRLAAVLALLAAGSCSRTLVFAEREGVNLAIRADATRTPPLVVNFGFNRIVGTVVPPLAEDGEGPATQPRGQAVSMVSGFQVRRFGEFEAAKPLNVDLTISSQFASGRAATEVAGNASAVAAIVSFTDAPVDPTLPGLQQRVRDASLALADPTFTATQQRRAAASLGVAGLATLSDAQVNGALRARLDQARTDPVALDRLTAALTLARGR